MLIHCIRGLDGIAYTIVVILFLAIRPSAACNEVGQVEIWCTFPLAALCWFCLRLPVRLDDDPIWPTRVLTLRCAAVAQTMLAPFLVWWFNFPTNNYLLVNSIMAVAAMIAFLYYLNELGHHLAKTLHFRRLQSAMNFGRHFVLYGSFVPFASILLSYVIDHYRALPRSVGDIYTLLLWIPDWLRLAFLAPVIFSVAGLFQLRILLARQLDQADRQA